MDPKQNNNSFGSLSSGGNEPVAGGADGGSAPVDGGVTGGVPGGVPVTGTPVGAGGVPASATSDGVPGGTVGTAGTAGTAGMPAAGAPVGTMPVGTPVDTMPAGTPAAVGGNTLFPGTVGVAGAGGVGAGSSVSAGGIGTGAAGFNNVGTNGVAGANPMATGVFGQAGANPGQANAIFGQGNIGSAAPIGSATSDVVIGGGAQQKPKKALVIGAIAAAVLIVAGLIMGVMFGQGGGGSGDSGQVSSADQKTLFNSYVNYVMFGEDSSEDLTEERASEYRAYFESLVNDGDALIKYTLEANKKFGDFKTSYSGGEYGDHALLSLDDYFQRFPSAMPITVKEMSDLFKQSGRESVESLIDNRYSIGTGDDDSASGDYLYYIDVVREYSEFRLSIIERASMEDCTLNESLESDCYALSGDDIQTAQNYDQELLEAEFTMRQNAFVAIQDLYDEIYGLDGEDDDTEDSETSSDDTEQTDEGSSTDETGGRTDENSPESEGE